MAATKRKVTLLAHTQLSPIFTTNENLGESVYNLWLDDVISDSKGLALTAIRTCYSPGKPSEILPNEGKRYFAKKATDGGKGTDADRLIRMIQSSGHTSTLEHISFNFAVEGVSRALLAQLTRHRVGFSFSVQSQRYVKFGSGDKSGGFEYVLPETVAKSEKEVQTDIFSNFEGVGEQMPTSVYFDRVMNALQIAYDELRKAGVPAEDARAVLPNAAACNMTLTINLRALLDFYSKRKSGRGAQAEIAGLAEDLKNAVVEVEPWLAEMFEAV